MRAALLLLAAVASAQTFEQRGFIEATGLFFPQTTPNDSSYEIGEVLVRYEAFYRPSPEWRFAADLDFRSDTHHETERDPGISWWDRERRRPMFDMRRLSVTYTHGKLTVEAGRQFIRWGKTDIVNPTDRFAPRDYLNVVANDFLGVTAARVTYGTQSDTIDLVASPRFTPSRIPILDQRWAAVPAGIPLYSVDPVYPGGSQFGARWNHIGTGAEYSLSFYNGFDTSPLLLTQVRFVPLSVGLQPYYPQLRMYGGDLAVPLPFVTVKAEAGYFTSNSARADEYGLFVTQLERQMGEWTFVAGYAGQAISSHGTAFAYSPQRGLTRAVVARASYTIDVNRAFALETAVRQNGRGYYVKPEYSQALGQHWRVTVGFSLIRGDDGDFLGQYRRNSFGLLSFRYSF
jgi:hypothetical protein